MTAANSKYPYYAVHQMHPLLPSELELDGLRPPPTNNIPSMQQPR
ncbi:hypothetical protein [Caballeronia sp. KNU42]